MSDEVKQVVKGISDSLRKALCDNSYHFGPVGLEDVVRMYYKTRGLTVFLETGEVFREGQLVGHHGGATIKGSTLEIKFSPIQPIEYINVTIEVKK